MNAEISERLSKYFGEMQDNLGKNSKECDALSAKAGELEKRLAALRDAPLVNEKKMEVLELQMVSDIKPIAHLGTLVKNHRSTCLFENSEKKNSCGGVKTTWKEKPSRQYRL